ncbi:hypothetical protein GCM10009634_40040 [Saccharothrix xinjiangensis]
MQIQVAVHHTDGGTVIGGDEVTVDARRHRGASGRGGVGAGRVGRRRGVPVVRVG